MKENISEKILEIAVKVLNARGITKSPSFEDSLAEDSIGLDSIGRLELLAEIEKELKVEFPEEYWGNRTFKNLEEIVQFISMK